MSGSGDGVGRKGAGSGAGRAGRSHPGARLFVWMVLSLAILCVAGVAGALVISHTATGREAALEWLIARAESEIDGSVSVGSVSPGGLFGGATLHGIRVSDSRGHPVLVVDSARAGYSIAELLSVRPGFDEIELWSPVLDLAPPGGGRIRLDDLFRPDGGAPAPAADAPSDDESGSFLLRGARIHEGALFVRGNDGERTRVRGINGSVGQVELRTEVERVVMAEVEDLAFAYPLGDGLLEVREARGTVEADDDQVIVRVDRFELPASEGRGTVHVALGGDDMPTVFDLEMDRLALADLDWLDARFDRGAARGGVRIATEPSLVRVDFADAEAELGAARLGVAGALTVHKSADDSVHFEAMSVTPTRLPVSEVNRWLTDPAPLDGLLSGEVRFDGHPARLSLAGELALLSESGREVVARLAGSGTVLDQGALEDVSLAATELDYGLLRILTPEVPWAGSGGITLRLDGDLATGMDVEIIGDHIGREGTPSTLAVEGTVYGDTSVSVVDLGVRMDPLSLTSLGDLYEGFPLSGEVGGTISLSGPLDELRFAADLETAAGRLASQGQINARDPASGYRLAATVEDFDLSRLVDGLPEPFSLTASATLNGRGLELESVRSALVLNADSVTIGRLVLDSAGVRARVDDDGLLQVASVRAETGGIVLQGAGSLGTVSEAGEGVVLSLSSPTLEPLREFFMGPDRVAWDELLPIEQTMMIQFEGVDPDTVPRAVDLRFGGAVDARARITGALAGLSASAAARFDNLEYGPTSARSLQADFTLSGLGRGNQVVVDGTVSGDSVSFRDRRYRSALVETRFTPGSSGRVRALITRSDSESYDVQAVVSLDGGSGRVDLDRLTLVRDDRRWNLRGPARMEWTPEAVSVSDFGLIRPGTEGLRVRADGLLARGGGESDFALEVADLDLGVVGSLLQLEGAPRGVVRASLRASGTGHEPEWTGTVEVSDVEYETLSFDRVVADAGFADGILRARMESWRGGRRNLRADGSIPMDLRLVEVPDRIPDDQLDVQIVADSFPAAMLLGRLRSLEEIGGTVSGEVRLSGRAGALEPDGSLHLDDASAWVAPLGVRLASAQMDLDLDPSGVMAVSGSAVSGGTVDFRGTVGGDGPPDDIALNLAFWPREFQVVRRPDIEAAITGDSLALTGTFNLPFIEGRVEVNDGTVNLEEYQRTAELIDFYDPALLSAATVQGSVSDDDWAGGVGERSPFLQNLRLLVDVHVGRGNRLRSRRMTVVPAGDLELTFDRAGSRLIVRGEMEVVRGDFRLGPSTLNIEDGLFTFPGTPGFDPDIDVTAVTRARTGDGEPIEITTSITGTLLQPLTAFTSDATYTIPEPELFTLLVLGRPTGSLLGDGAAGSFDAGSRFLAGQLYSEFAYLLGEGLDVFDYLRVSQADQGPATSPLGPASLEVEVGWYVLRRAFLTGVYQRGFCADPTVPVSSGGVRLEVELPRDVVLEGFLEGRCTRERYRGLGDISLELAHIWGFSFFREWGY